MLGCHGTGNPAADPVRGNHSVVRVTVTSQSYDFLRPWLKHQPFTRRAIAPVIAGNRFLVTAEIVSNATYLEVEKAESGVKTPVTVEWVDYEANLAVLKPSDPGFCANLVPLELVSNAVRNDSLQIWQLENNDTLATTEGHINTVDVGRYTDDSPRLLLYRLNLSLQIREGSSTLPALKDGKLAGLLYRYDSKTQNATVIPSPIIKRFLKEAAEGRESCFPRTGFSYCAMRDPQLRRYASAEKEAGGVYLTHVHPEGPAAKSGLKPGDVILAVGGIPLDQDGNYPDPLYGKISIDHWITSLHAVGDKLQVRVLRQGTRMEFTLELNRRKAADYVIPPYCYDHAPKYYILGGLIFLELSRTYLKEWGENWVSAAPQKQVFQDAYQEELFGPGKKRLVVLSQVLPAPSNIGFERLRSLTLTKINGKEIQELADIDSALRESVTGFYTVEFQEDPKIIHLSIARLRLEEPQLQKLYQLGSLKRLD